jgi:hypothetical protein
MKNTLKKITTLLAACTIYFNADAQLKIPAASSFQTVTQAFGLGEIKIEYCRPGIKGRVIYGGLVPYNKPWRTGANASTKITIDEGIKINAVDIAKGTYALYTIPSATEWEIILSKDLTIGANVEDYKPTDEVMRFKATPKMMNDKLETFTIEINNVTPASCSIDLVWDKTLVSIPVTTSVDEKIMKQIDKELAADKRPYYSAANYYFENGKDINKAAEWINKAVENNPNAYWMWQVKAKIFMKMNNKAEALKAAETSLAKAREDKNDEFVVSNEKLITEIKAMK